MAALSKQRESQRKIKKSTGWMKTNKMCAFASYSFKDKAFVKPYLDLLSYSGMKIVNPDTDFIPGQTVFQNILQKGIETANLSVIFVSRNFLSSGWCDIETKLAIQKYVKTKGVYRLIPIVLESCKMPNYLKVFNCIHVWKYELRRSECHMVTEKYCHLLIERLIKAVTAPPMKFQSIRWMGMKMFHRGTNLVSRIRMDSMKDKIREDVPSSSMNLLTIWKLPSILNHCILYCKYGRCNFSCSGKTFMKFHEHSKSCKYIPIRCTNKNCQFVFPRKDMLCHLRSCSESLSECEFKDCHVVIKRKDLIKHQELCAFRLVSCPNKDHGCRNIFRFCDKDDHLQSCDFGFETCAYCKHSYIRITELHEDKCPMSFILCPYCDKDVRLMNLLNHLESCKESMSICPNRGCNERLSLMAMLRHKSVCSFRKMKCSNVWCGFSDTFSNLNDHMAVCDFRQMRCNECGLNIFKKDLRMHEMVHDGFFICDLCKLTFPKSSKPMHDTWLCSRRNFVSQCDICKTIVPFTKLEDHRNEHFEKLDKQQIEIDEMQQKESFSQTVETIQTEDEKRERGCDIKLAANDDTPESKDGRGIILEQTYYFAENLAVQLKYLASSSEIPGNYSSGRQKFMNLLKQIEQVPLSSNPTKDAIEKLCFTFLRF